MRRLLFWLVTATVLGFCTHVAFILFVPSRNFSAALDAAMAGKQVNSFVVLDAETHMKLLPFAASHHLAGLCKFDLRAGPIKIAAELPEGFWTLAVYTIRGQQVYAINDTQADTNSFTVEINRDGGVISQLLGNADDAQDIDDDQLGWRISMTDAEGVALLWLPVADPLLRKDAEAAMAKSRCLRLDK
jgi:uncharacterized membrane protein